MVSHLFSLFAGMFLATCWRATQFVLTLFRAAGNGYVSVWSLAFAIVSAPRHFDLSAPAMPIFTLKHTHTRTQPDMGKQTAMTNPQNPATTESLSPPLLGSSC